MVRGYQVEEIKEKLVKILSESDTGLSGVEIAKKLNVNRITISKYLKVFAAEGFVKEKNIGNVILWFIEEGIEKFYFPDDYFKVKSKYIEYLNTFEENRVYNLIRNCIHSEAKIPKIINEIIVPAIKSTKKLYDDGKIGNSEQKFLTSMISNSINLTRLTSVNTNPKKNLIILSADFDSSLLAEAASSSLHSDQWNVSYLGDMSSSMDVLFDLDLQKFLGKIWKQKKGIMIIVVFSETQEGLNFFAQSINSVKEKLGSNLHLVLCGKDEKKITIDADLVTDNLGTISQWSQTVFESQEF